MKLEEVTRSDEDRILRALWSALSATVRTNAYQTSATGEFKDYLSFKLESHKLRELPLPKPMFEVFVFSTRMEGVHLRMGFVARGGIRWSDRREDFRTEVLGLMKAQQVKNTVIVPVGAKGGFVVRRPLVGDRESQLAEVVACYQTLIRGLLDLTDNIVEDDIIAPAARGASRRRRCLSRRGGGQGHRHVLGHRQRDLGGIRLLAGRCFRIGRLGRV
jgi:glutamate dehydrogenase